MYCWWEFGEEKIGRGRNHQTIGGEGINGDRSWLKKWGNDRVRTGGFHTNSGEKSSLQMD
jgi:hypothetical protein